MNPTVQQSLASLAVGRRVILAKLGDRVYLRLYADDEGTISGETSDQSKLPQCVFNGRSWIAQ
jgi:hypothetical protein